MIAIVGASRPSKWTLMNILGNFDIADNTNIARGQNITSLNADERWTLLSSFWFRFSTLSSLPHPSAISNEILAIYSAT